MPGSQAVSHRPCKWFVAGVLLLAGFAVQAEWEITPGIGLGVVYSDNVFLDPDDLAREDTVTEVIPGIAISYAGPRVDLNLDYRMLNYFYAEDSDLDNTYHQLDSNATAELVREAVFLDAGAVVRQQIIDPAGPIGGTPAIGSSNITDEATYFLSPYWRSMIGGDTEWQLRYTEARLDYDDPTLADSDHQSAAASLDSQDPGRRLSWGLSYSGTRTDYETGERIELQRAFAELGLRVTRVTRLVALGGYEENDFDTNEPDPPEGSFWAVGLRSQRDGRYEVEALAGERFFGETYRFSWVQRARRWDLELAYSEDFTTSAGSSLQSDPAAQPSLPGQSVGTLSSEVFLSRLGSGTLTFGTARTQVSISGFDEKREFQASDNEERVRGVDLGLRWQLQPRTGLSANLAGRDNTLVGETVPDRIRSATIGLDYRLSPRVVASVEGRYTDRASDVVARDYRERGASLRLTAEF
jgi:hypothetical protein